MADAQDAASSSGTEGFADQQQHAPEQCEDGSFGSCANDEGAEGGGIPEDMPGFFKQGTGEGKEYPWLVLGGLLLLAALFFVYREWRARRDRSPDDDVFRQIGEKEYRYSVQGVEEYYAFKEKFTGDDPRPLQQELFKRVVANVPLLQHLQKMAQSTHALYSKGMIQEAAWANFKQSEEDMKAEIADVREEANDIAPGFGDAIWPQAVKWHEQMMAQRQRQMMEMHQKQMIAQKEAQEREAAKIALQKKKRADKQREKRRNSGSNNGVSMAQAAAQAVEKELTPEEKAEQAAAQLLLLEQEEAAKKEEAKHTGGKKKKK